MAHLRWKGTTAADRTAYAHMLVKHRLKAAAKKKKAAARKKTKARVKVRSR